MFWLERFQSNVLWATSVDSDEKRVELQTTGNTGQLLWLTTVTRGSVSPPFPQNPGFWFQTPAVGIAGRAPEACTLEQMKGAPMFTQCALGPIAGVPTEHEGVGNCSLLLAPQRHCTHGGCHLNLVCKVRASSPLPANATEQDLCTLEGGRLALRQAWERRESTWNRRSSLFHTAMPRFEVKHW